MQILGFAEEHNSTLDLNNLVCENDLLRLRSFSYG